MRAPQISFNTLPLAFVARNKGGLFIDGDWIESKDLSDEGVKYLTTGNVGIGEFKEQGSGFISKETFSKLRCTEVKPGDILISRLNLPVGRACVVPELGEKLVTSVDNVIVRPSSDFDRRFLVYLFSAPKHLENTSNLARGTTMQRISRSMLGRIRLEIPDLPTQKRTADFLDAETARIDALITLRSEFEKKVAESREALIASLLVGLPEENQRPSTTDWLENLPQGISKERAKVHFRERVERSDTGGEELLTVSHITGVTKRSEKNVNMIMAESNEGYKLVQPEDLVVNTMWAWMGAMGVSKETGLISPAYGIYRPISGRYMPEYIDLLVRSKPFVAEATRRSKGIHSSRLRLYPDAFLGMRLPVPTLDQQESILTKISARAVREDALVQKNTKATELLREYRAALITAAVTGQIDVEAYARTGASSAKLDQIEEAMQG